MAIHLPNDSKPIDLAFQPFHRIGAPNYDLAVDTASGDSDTRRGAKQAPSGLARESGARGPDAFQESGFLGKVLVLLAKLAKAGLKDSPLFPIALLDDAIKKLTKTSPIEALSKLLGNLLGSAVEGALFARYLRAIPAWVPVGRQGYTNQFTYREDAAARTTVAEEEREVEGLLVASYPIANDPVFTQWDHFRHWAFHVQPTPGFRYLVGRGNIADANEQKFMKDFNAPPGEEAFRAAVSIYGQTISRNALDTGALECLMDIGAISLAPGDRGTQGVMFNPAWPFWPMVGDHFWATGRWAYDCMRAVGTGTRELFPTQINPIKAFAVTRFEGFKFAENAFAVPASRFFFFATTEGGYTEFRQKTDRNGGKNISGVTLDDRDYTFIVDLPPIKAVRSDFTIGGTIDFPLNRIVLRPRLLVDIKQAPFGIERDQFAGLTFKPIEPIIEVLRPADPGGIPTQAKITIPLSSLKASAGAEEKRAVGLNIALGWHDPDDTEARKLFKVTVRLHKPMFVSQGGTVRFASAINGRWNVLATDVDEANDPKGMPTPGRPVVHERTLFLEDTSRLFIVSNGVWRHGFGEFIEQSNSKQRTLRVGPLIDVDSDTKKKMKQLLDDARKDIDNARKLGKDVKDPKQLLKRQLQARIDALRAQGAPQKAVDQLQKQMDDLVNGLPDAPDAFRNALDGFDKQLGILSDALGALDDFLKLTDDLVGPNHEPGWHEDIDAAIKQGLEESRRVSEIARAMFLHPTPIINKADEPLGWAEFVDDARPRLSRSAAGDLIKISRSSASVSALRSSQPRSGPLQFGMIGNRFTIVGSGSNLAEQISPTDDKTDYLFEVNVSIVPQVP